MGDIALRLADKNDAHQVSSLIATVWSKHFAYSVSPSDLEHFVKVKLAPEQIAQEIADPVNTFVIATMTSGTIQEEADDTIAAQEQVIAVAQLVRGTTEPCLTFSKPIELRRLYVSDEHHGKGLAQRIVAHAEDLAREEGFDSVWLGVWEDNTRGLEFYRKMGFVEKGEHTFLVGESVRRDWVMEKSLEPESCIRHA